MASMFQYIRAESGGEVTVSRVLDDVMKRLSADIVCTAGWITRSTISNFCHSCTWLTTDDLDDSPWVLVFISLIPCFVVLSVLCILCLYKDGRSVQW